MGRARVICAYEVDGWIVDPGPASCVETLIDRLGPTVPEGLLLTHIHLDHAGAAGVLCRRYPELVIYVHELGAPHLVDPSKLLASVSRLQGGDIEELWGETLPVPEERIRTLAGGETVEGFRVAYTPGHASHHVCYLHEQSRDAYVGDMAGVRIPPHELTLAPTPPPDIDIEAWLESLHTIAAWNPQALHLTHFGPVTDVADQLHRIRTSLTDVADRSRLDGEERFIAGVEDWLRNATDEATVETYEQVAPLDQLYQGLERYWRKKAG
jgi:glyoxylase-like metal-dependent hydrolase (beta-lactamase superfamily II)